MHTISNRFIVSLAVSDLIIGIEGYPLFTLYVLNGDRWPLGWIACETWLFLDYTLCLVSILTVLLITADRYLSVCHTASYIKWQSPSKAQVTIILSWIIPAFIFGFTIYGWSLMSTSSTGLVNGECAAPFLANPYVNMGMYVVYYWTTLVAMLILYKGIHKVTKKLEKRAGAKERRHLALLFSQRLGTQVGVKLMFSQPNNDCDERTVVENAHIAGDIAKDNDYHTFTGNVMLQISATNSKTDKADMGMVHNVKEETVLKSLSSWKPSSSTEPFLSVEKQTPKINFLKPIRSPSRIVNLKHDTSLLDGYDKPEIKDEETLREMINDRSSDVPDINVTPIAIIDSGVHVCDQPLSASLDCSDKPSNQVCATRHAAYRRYVAAFRRETVSVKRFSKKWVRQIKSQVAGALGGERDSFHSRSSSSLSTTSSVENSHSKALVVKQTKINIPTITVTRQDSVSRNDRRKKQTPLSSTISSSRRNRKCLQLMANPMGRPRISTVSLHSRPSRKLSLSNLNLKRERILQSIFSPLALLQRKRKQTKAERRAHKAFRTITFIVGCFAILWSPYYVVATVYGFCRQCIPTLLYTLTYYMCYLNSSGNPFAYALANRQFRAAFLRMLRGNFSKNF
ncbi:unnamed protein product [Thelazia callipaeda]|uniref:G_PROTEIN_RECEP_F1_2 domain-containing protein n=1 Tax=Thelazia callipaeda TaxID=103827 RepID=A0A0N5D829_THECL|nr:unnamed protein product [Thelazia callipaeda]